MSSDDPTPAAAPRVQEGQTAAQRVWWMEHAAGTEALARILYAAHCGWGNIVGTNAIGAWNMVLLIIAGMFGVSKLGQNLHSIWNRQLYIEYVNREKEAGIR